MKNLSRAILFLILTIELFFGNFVLGKEKIDINTASKEELQKIIGVGPVIAQRIIEARPFSSIYDLLKVKGIGEKTLEKIIEQGLAWVSESPQKPNLKQSKPQEIENQKSKITTQKNLAIVSQQNSRLSASFDVFSIALIIAIFSAITILILKKKLKTFDL